MNRDIFTVAQQVKRIRARNDPDNVTQECQNANKDSPLSSRKSKNRRITGNMFKAWKAARPWLLARLPELEAQGWTRSKLFRAGRMLYPFGPWGAAWCDNWLIPDVEVKIDSEGAIRWTWTEATGRTVTQAKRPYP